MITITNGGVKTAAAAAVPPANPATRYPMNAAVMTTGPGVIIATAIASRNWRSVSQWCSRTHDAAIQERHDGQSAAEDKCAGLEEEQSQRSQNAGGRRALNA